MLPNHPHMIMTVSSEGADIKAKFSQLGAVRLPSRAKATANAAGRAENITLFCVVSMGQGDYIEVHCANKNAIADITVDSMNFLASEIR